MKKLLMIAAGALLFLAPGCNEDFDSDYPETVYFPKEVGTIILYGTSWFGDNITFTPNSSEVKREFEYDDSGTPTVEIFRTEWLTVDVRSDCVLMTAEPLGSNKSRKVTVESEIPCGGFPSYRYDRIIVHQY